MAKTSKISTNKKRANSTMVARSFKKTRQSPTSIESLPRELISEILARVGASSYKDVFNAKMSCKMFYEVAEDAHIYQHMSLDDLPLISRNSSSEKQQAFLRRCKECQNPELMSKQAVIDYFTGKGVESGLICLQRAAELQNIGAMYVTCIVLLFSRNDELKENCIRMLADMKRCKPIRRELKVHRENLIYMLKQIWVKASCIRDRPICCIREDNHKRRTGWPVSPDELEQDVYCEACNAVCEIRFIRRMYSQQ